VSGCSLKSHGTSSTTIILTTSDYFLSHAAPHFTTSSHPSSFYSIKARDLPSIFKTRSTHFRAKQAVFCVLKQANHPPSTSKVNTGQFAGIPRTVRDCLSGGLFHS
jgi:hypothetical protein